MSNYRIISLFPSSSDIIVDLKLEQYLVAVSHECNSSHHFKNLPKVTSTSININSSQLDIDKQVRDKVIKREPIYKIDTYMINFLKPTHILTQGICDVCAVSSNTVEATLRENRFELSKDTQIISLNGSNFLEICEDVLLLGKTFRKFELASKLVNQSQKKWFSLQTKKNNKKLLMLEWLDPPFSPGHWIPEQIELAGFESLFSSRGEVSKALKWEDILKSNPDYIGVICCGFGLNENRVFAKQLYNNKPIEKLKAIQNGNIFAFDSEMYFSKPSLKIVEGAELICNILENENNIYRCLRQ